MKQTLMCSVLLLACCGVQGEPPVSANPAPVSPAAASPAPADRPAAREPKPASAAAPATPAKAKPVRFSHLTIDPTAGEIRIAATVAGAEYSLEFFLVSGEEKAYESVLKTPAKPWQVHAGLLMLGLTPGVPGRYHGDTYIPPRGAALGISLRWTDSAGKKHEIPASDWLSLTGKAPKGKTPAKPKSWVFLGSVVQADGRYLADAVTGIIAVANLDSAVIDVPFTSTRTMNLREFVLNKKAIPPVGTKVEVVIRPLPGGKKAPYARAILDIGRLGQMRIDGKAITMEKLPAWAKTYTLQHRECMVVILSAGLAPSGLASVAALELKLGGVYDTQTERRRIYWPMLPRTEAQARRALAAWSEKFANPQDEVLDPAKAAHKAQAAIRRERAELKRRGELLERYETALELQREAYQNAQAKQARKEKVPGAERE